MDALRKPRAAQAPREAADVPTSDRLVKRYLEAHPDAMARYEGRVTVDMLRLSLPWAEALPSPGRLLLRQIADLKHRLRDADLDSPGGDDQNEEARLPIEPEEAAPPVAHKTGTRPGGPTPPPKTMTQEDLQSRMLALRRGFPCGIPPGTAPAAEHQALAVQLQSLQEAANK